MSLLVGSSTSDAAIRLAATIFNVFVASDTASDAFASMKRLHGLMPYFVLKGILKVSNPMAMIRGESTSDSGSISLMKVRRPRSVLGETIWWPIPFAAVCAIP